MREAERKQQKEYKQKMRKNSEIRSEEQQNEKEYKQKVRQSSEIRSEEQKKDREYRQKVRQNSEIRSEEQLKEKEYKQKVRQSSEIRSEEQKKDKEYRQKVRQSSEIRSEEQKKDREYRQKVRQNSEIRSEEQLKEKEYKQKVRQSSEIRSKEKKKDREYRQSVRQSSERRSRELDKDREYRKELRKDPLMHEKQKEQNSQYKRNFKIKYTHIDAVVQRFKDDCKEMPCFVCAICYRLMFKKQVKRLNKEKYIGANFVTSCISLANLHEPMPDCTDKCTNCAKWICLTCDRNLSLDKVPNQALANNMSLPQQPECMSQLNQLEKHLVSPVPFMKILPLPKGQQKGVHGPVVCVPADLSTVTQILPRQLSDDSLVKVKLKRKLEYRGHHLFQQVSMQKLKSALEHLKTVNPHFTDIVLDLGTINPSEEPGLVLPEPESESIEHVHVANTNSISSSPTHSVIEVLDADDLNETLTQPDIVTNQSTQEQAQTHDLTETSAPMVSCLQPEDLQQVVAGQQHPDDHLSIAPAEGQRPCSVQQEMKAFPYLFPDGKNGFQEERNTRLGVGRYVNSRLFSKDIRFASDPQYIFFWQYVSELNNINSSASIAMRKGGHISVDGKKITAIMITDTNQRNRILNTDEGYHFLKTIRGSPAYWEKCLKDIFAMVKQLGIPTWFCSFSAADRRWPEIIETICKQQGKEVPENLDWTEYCQLINSNPVTACRMFEHRVQSFISDVILSPANPIGHVIDYFYRTEFQSRGWPHIHCLFWCKNSPKFDSSDANNSAFIKYIDKYVTSTTPDESDDPELHELVTKVQTHSKQHSRSCKKGNKTCRFNFPRPLSTETFIAIPTPPPENTIPAIHKRNATNVLTSIWDAIDKIDSHSAAEIFQILHLSQEQYQKAHCALASRNTVIFKRDIQDLWVNPYNAILLRTWNANMDIQPVLDAYSCIMYIVSYISKAERELGDVLRKAQEEADEGHMEPIKQLRRLGTVYLNAREVSVMEAVYRVCGMKLKQCTREVVFVPAHQNVSRLTKPIEVLKQSEEQSDDIWMLNIVDRYLSRPETEEFEDMSLAHFASNYKVNYSKMDKHDHDDDVSTSDCSSKVYTLLNKMGTIIKRKTPSVIRYVNCNKDKNSENYFYNHISMYYPHRSLEFKPHHIETYEQMFNQYSDIILQNMEPYEKLSLELEDAWKRLQEGGSPEQVWADIAANQEVDRIEDDEELDVIRREMLEGTEEIDPADIPDINTTDTSNKQKSFITPQVIRNSNNEHLNMIRTLNERQSRLYHFVKSWAEYKKHGDPNPFCLLLSGGAGTGKSHTIRCIYNEVDRTLTRKSENADSPVVLLVAYTGTAAYNIGGQTIHSAFTINHSKHLAEEAANTLRAKLQDLQLLIIDEVSMVSTDLLNLIHCRLQQIKKPSKPNSVFGNISILAVGDFYQIPPICGKSLISMNSTLTDLWSLFSIWNLTEVVRQKGDNTFIEMLNRLRVRLRNQEMNIDDLNFLKSRIVSKSSPDFPQDVLHIAATHKQLDVSNSQYLNQLSKTEKVFDIEAADICHDKKTQKSFKRNEPLQVKNTALPIHLKVCLGARVMLTQNLDVSDGLTNGVQGTVTGIIQGQMLLGMPTAICVLFDHPKIGSNSRMKTKPPSEINQMSTVIKPQTEVIQKSPYQVTRHQFPLILAWAVTIHKTQGLTTDRAIVSLKCIFKSGMAYVALSRVTSGKGLYLLDEDFDVSVIYSDPKVTNQLNKMTQAEFLPEWKQLHITETISTHPGHILIASHNCEGYIPHFKDISNNKFLQKADIITLQEIWTSPNMNVLSALPNHHIEIKHRQNYNQSNIRGGVAILVHQDFDYIVIDTSEIQIECIGVQLTSPPMSVFSIYRPPQLSLKDFCKQMDSLLKKITTPTSIIAGDFNVNLLNTSNTLLASTMFEHQQVIATPTARSRTLIDHIYVKNTSILQSGVVPTYYSFHDMTFVNINSSL